MRRGTTSLRYAVMKYIKWLGPPSTQYRGYLARTAAPDQSIAPHSQECLVHCCVIRANIFIIPVRAAGSWHCKNVTAVSTVTAGPIQLDGQKHQPQR